MKKTYLIIFLLALIACNDDLKLKPTASLDQSVALSTESNIQTALLGAYDGLSGYSAALGSYGFMWGGDLFLYSELLAADGEITWVGTFNQPREIYGKKILTNNSFVRSNWTGGFYTINICNNILESVDIVKDEFERKRIKGEALFIRGSVYFELVRFFGQSYSAGNTSSNLAVPLVLASTKSINEDSFPARATVEQIYQQVIADLTQAESLMLEYSSSPDGSENDPYATHGAAAAILSRVYLSMGDFTKARDAADRVISSGNYDLTDTYAEAFNNSQNSTEDIFAMQVNDQDGTNDMQLYCSIPAYGGRDGDVQIEQKHLNLYETGDERLGLFYTGNGAIRTGKWKLQYKNVTVVRLAEMYLTRAECNYRLSTAIGDTPANDLNLIRSRVGLDPVLVPDLDDILKERKLELALEGSRIHDLKRLQGSADGFAYNADAMVFPIPAREISANKNLKQNPGYGDN
jgi:hypothetical protein